MMLVNGITVASMRWHAPWSGVWTAELELASGSDLPSAGRCVIASDEGLSLAGAVLEAALFGAKAFVRVVGGAGGWHKNVRAQHFHSDGGVQLAILASTTATEVGEAVTVLAPAVLGPDFVRAAKPASQIFTDAGVDWWVGADGVTRVGVRPPVVAAADLAILDWDAASGTVAFTSSALVEPGTVLVDDRFGTRVVREVEADVSNGSVTGTLWTSDAAADAGAVTGLVDDLAALACEATRIAYARVYPYEVVAMSGDQVELAALEPGAGMPDIIPASIWAGASGYRADLRPGSRVLVGFIAGDPKRPFVAAYEPPEDGGWRPPLLELDALDEIRIGGEGATGVATQQSLELLFEQLNLFFTAIQPFLNFPLIGGLSGGTAQAAATPAATVAGILAAGASNFSQRVKANL